MAQYGPIDISGVLRAREQQAAIAQRNAMMEIQAEEQEKARRAARIRTLMVLGGAAAGGFAAPAGATLAGVQIGAAAGDLGAGVVTREPMNPYAAVQLASAGIERYDQGQRQQRIQKTLDQPMETRTETEMVEGGFGVQVPGKSRQVPTREGLMTRAQSLMEAGAKEGDPGLYAEGLRLTASLLPGGGKGPQGDGWQIVANGEQHKTFESQSAAENYLTTDEGKVALKDKKVRISKIAAESLAEAASRTEKAPAGYEWTDDKKTNLKVIPGGPADKQGSAAANKPVQWAAFDLEGNIIPMTQGPDPEAAEQEVQRKNVPYSYIAELPAGGVAPRGAKGGEALVQVQDPNDPTRSIYVTKEEALGRRTAQGTRTPNNVQLPDGKFVISLDGRTYTDPQSGEKKDLPSNSVIVGEDTVVEAKRLAGQVGQARIERDAMKKGAPLPLPSDPQSATEAQPPQEATGMFKAAGRGTGPASNLKSVANAVIGGAADLAGLQANLFPDNVAHRQQLELFNQEVVRAISNNPRYPVAEVERIRERITVDPKTFWVNPQDATRKMLGIRGFLEETRRTNLEQMASGTLTTQEMNAYRSNNAEINRILGFMGNPGRQTPHGSIVEEAQAGAAGAGQPKENQRINELLNMDTSKMNAADLKNRNDELERLLK